MNYQCIIPLLTYGWGKPTHKLVPWRQGFKTSNKEWVDGLVRPNPNFMAVSKAGEPRKDWAKLNWGDSLRESRVQPFKISIYVSSWTPCGPLPDTTHWRTRARRPYCQVAVGCRETNRMPLPRKNEYEMLAFTKIYTWREARREREREREPHQEICGLPTAYRIGFINQYKRLLPRKVWPKCTYRIDTWKGTWVV